MNQEILIIEGSTVLFWSRSDPFIEPTHFWLSSFNVVLNGSTCIGSSEAENSFWCLNPLSFSSPLQCLPIVLVLIYSFAHGVIVRIILAITRLEAQ